MIRAFVAIDLPHEAAGRLDAIGQKLKELKLDGRPVKGESIHLTLKFLGNIDEGKIPQIQEALQEVSARTSEFELEVGGLGVFPHPARPRVVWVGVERNETLRELQRQTEAALVKLGFDAEERDFQPHLTVVRLKSGRNLRELIDSIRNQGADERVGRLRVNEFHLYQSVLKPGGSEYRKLFTMKLQARVQ
ncbi:MAG: RNA 2',3'-cyclic phosphodiesterase [Acidobacteriota bacterium]